MTWPANLKGWDATGNAVTLAKGGIGIGYRNGFLGTVSKNLVVNEVQPNEYTDILAEGVMGSDLTANTVTQRPPISAPAQPSAAARASPTPTSATAWTTPTSACSSSIWPISPMPCAATT